MPNYTDITRRAGKGPRIPGVDPVKLREGVERIFGKKKFKKSVDRRSKSVVV